METTNNNDRYWTTAHVARIPTCDFCDDPAEFDAREARSTMWAYMCAKHFAERSTGKLGLGLGQRLVLS